MRRFLVSFSGLILATLLSCGQNYKNNSKASVLKEEISLGAWNAVRKAHQMTDLPICAHATLYVNKNKTYSPGKEDKGLIYSSTREINTSVGQDVSFHTFMTALHNPKSLLYSEKINQPPYHGTNCRAYYGTVCSGLVTYALGLKITLRTADIPAADYFELVEDQSANGVQVADVLWNKGHVMLVTAVERNTDGRIGRIEYCESVETGARRCVLGDGAAFNKLLVRRKLKIYRYKELYKNVDYTPINEFVAVDGERKIPFKYNDDICTNKGDKACYITGEKVVLNVFGPYRQVEIYKDSTFYKKVNVDQNNDVILSDLPYGDYQARAVNGSSKSDDTRWKVIDVNVRIDRDKNRICFSSANATPVYYEFSDIAGNRPVNKVVHIYAAELTEEQVKDGYVTVMAPNKPTGKKTGNPYVKVHFECDYGMVINKPLYWFK